MTGMKINRHMLLGRGPGLFRGFAHASTGSTPQPINILAISDQLTIVNRDVLPRLQGWMATSSASSPLFNDRPFPPPQHLEDLSS